jgi:hypothetical protein
MLPVARNVSVPSSVSADLAVIASFFSAIGQEKNITSLHECASPVSRSKKRLHPSIDRPMPVTKQRIMVASHNSAGYHFKVV